MWNSKFSYTYFHPLNFVKGKTENSVDYLHSKTTAKLTKVYSTIESSKDIISNVIQIDLHILEKVIIPSQKIYSILYIFIVNFVQIFFLGFQ